MFPGFTTLAGQNITAMLEGSANPAEAGSSSGPFNGQANMTEDPLNPQNAVQITAEEENGDSETATENLGSDNSDPNNSSRKKRYNRHSQEQIQQLEAFFSECKHPDDNQKKELGEELNLKPSQIKFWFQNRRTQAKVRVERKEISELRASVTKLTAENIKCRELIKNATCPTCGGPSAFREMSILEEQYLRTENTRLTEELQQMAAMAANYPSIASMETLVSAAIPQISTVGLENFAELNGAGGQLGGIGGTTNQMDKQIIFELAVVAMEELSRMAEKAAPLWIESVDSSSFLLNEEEYFKAFPRGIGPRLPGFRCESSCETAVLIINPSSIVEMLMDVGHWSSVFASMVSRADKLETVSGGVGGSYNLAFQLMTAEFQVISPFVQPRSAYFARYCKHHIDGSWAVVDVSVDSLRPSPPLNCRRRPSGCIIREMPTGCSKVTWVEHVEVADKGVHNIYMPLVNSGLAFGAKRWISTLDGQCERVASSIATKFPPWDLQNIDGRRSVLTLAERMFISFCGGAGASTAQKWSKVCGGDGADDIRVMSWISHNDLGTPRGVVLCATTSFWLPVIPKGVFEYLHSCGNRAQWDILSNGYPIEEIAHITNGRDSFNCVSILKYQYEEVVSILQESRSDQTGSFIVYAPIGVASMNSVVAGGDPDYVGLLPSGLVILPDGPVDGEGYGGGSLVTLALQILVDTDPNTKVSVASVMHIKDLITITVAKLKGTAGVGG